MEELGEHERDEGDGEEKSARGRPGTVEVQLGRSGDGDDEKGRCVQLITKAPGETAWQFPGRKHGEGGNSKGRTEMRESRKTWRRQVWAKSTSTTAWRTWPSRGCARLKPRVRRSSCVRVFLAASSMSQQTLNGPGQSARRRSTQQAAGWRGILRPGRATAG